MPELRENPVLLSYVRHYRGQVIKYGQLCFIWYCKFVWRIDLVMQDKPVGPVSQTCSPPLLPTSSGGQHCWPVSRSPVSHAMLHQCSPPPAQHEYCSCWSRQEEDCILWFSGLEGSDSWEGWVCLGAGSESPRRRGRTLDRDFLTRSCPCSRWCTCWVVPLLTQTCPQALWGPTHTRGELEESVWIEGERERQTKVMYWTKHSACSTSL